MLAVNPALQTAGVGSALWQAAEVQAKQTDCNSIRLVVIEGRDELIAYYQRRGHHLATQIFYS